MYRSENQDTARMSGGVKHETPPSAARHIDQILAEIDAVLEPQIAYPTWEREKELGRAVLNGEMTAEQAYEALAD